jgi:hypothetical protein
MIVKVNLSLLVEDFRQTNWKMLLEWSWWRKIEEPKWWQLTLLDRFLGLPQGVWVKEGGDKNAGEGIAIGFVDTGVTPNHPSFSYDPLNPFT